ncbi:MAG: AAA family ATPase, partial [Candidatus Gracilibacteria bacterium]
MNIRITKIQIENFRGIKKATAAFGEINFLIGNNGTGKTTMLAAIARLMPILRGENRIFLDADFYFHNSIQAKQIKIIYEIKLIEKKKHIQKIFIQVLGTRNNSGFNRSHLNDQIPAGIKVSIKDEKGNNKSELIKQLRGKNCFRQKIIRHGWTGNRIAPISLKRSERQKHAATSEYEEQGFFDGLRARLVQLLLDSNLGKKVSLDHPNLL